jgi:hypothetical protein
MPDTTLTTPDMAPSTRREKASKLIAIDKKTMNYCEKEVNMVIHSTLSSVNY